MALGRRCDAGCASWPNDDQYKVCPICDEPTTQFKNLQPMTASAARNMAFEVYYESKHKQRLELTDDEHARWDHARPEPRALLSAAHD